MIQKWHTYTFRLQFSFEYHVSVKLKAMEALRLLLPSLAFRFSLPWILFAPVGKLR